ncbi:MCE family protein [Aeromicrobium sp. CF3.5]|uniref:MCE family protein n=1 Tax=Aeromicrobium sp. CF3.5 TaxID=3373078 RepID=UPI003EE709C7
MTTRLTKIQLVIFAIITLIGGAIVGGRYAQLDRLFIDRTYEVTAQFSDSGGIFAGAQVTYRGIEVGTVGKLTFTPAGVEVRLDIEDSAPDIPADLLVVVANKSAIGEQYVDLQPRGRGEPFLADGSEVTLANTRIPIDTTTLLLDVNALVSSVDTDSLQTVVSELGQAFEGAGPDLSRILDTSSEFINAADDNIDVTRQLIRQSDQVLQTQIDKQDQLGTFSENLALFSDTLVDADPDLRRLLDDGTVAARNTDELVAENADDLTVVINNLITAGKPLAENQLGVRTIFTLYPYLLEGTYSALAEKPDEDGDGQPEYNARFGIVLNSLTSPVCTAPGAEGAGPESDGYRTRRDPSDVTDQLFPFQQGPPPVSPDCTVENTIARQPSKTDLEVRDLNRTAPAVSGKDALSWMLIDPASR